MQKVVAPTKQMLLRQCQAHVQRNLRFLQGNHQLMSNYSSNQLKCKKSVQMSHWFSLFMCCFLFFQFSCRCFQTFFDLCSNFHCSLAQCQRRRLLIPQRVPQRTSQAPLQRGRLLIPQRVPQRTSQALLRLIPHRGRLLMPQRSTQAPFQQRYGY